jgi:hypothetical protein
MRWTLAYMSAVAATALVMSADTSYRFLGSHLGITDLAERRALCVLGEAAIIGFALYSREMKSRLTAWLAYTFVLIQAVPAFSLSGGTGGLIRVALGPGLLALLLHFILQLDLRASGETSDSLISRVGREIRERLTAYLGIGRRGENSAAIARSRAADRAVALATDLAQAKEGSRAHRKLSAKLADAVDASRHDLSPEEAEQAEREIVSRVVRRKSVEALAGITARHTWSEGATERNLSPTSRLTESPENRILVAPESTEKPIEITARNLSLVTESPQYGTLDDAATLLAYEPPKWSSLTLREAVAKADEILPGKSARELAEALAEVGVETTDGSVRSTRSQLKKLREAAG